VTDFVNHKIKSAQSFGDTHRGRVCVRVFIGVSAYMCISIYVCTMFLKKGIHISIISGHATSTSVQHPMSHHFA
jgi:hypothetical protein